MAGQIKKVRKIDEILRELFQGRDAALEKYAKVRRTQYEMSLWRKYGLPLSAVDCDVRVYFQKRFLNGKTLRSASCAQIAEAMGRLNHAVEDGCRGRCMRLLGELEEALNVLGLSSSFNFEGFLDWLTFSYVVPKDEFGNPQKEKPYDFEMRVFYDRQNRKDFWAELSPMLREGKVMSMRDVYRFVYERRRCSVKF